MRNILPDNQMRAMTIAMAGAVVAAVATMFVPAGVLERLTGSTGLSEIIEAAKPPLGDTARALIAFGAGALTLAMLAYILLRHERPVAANVGEVSDDEASSPLRHLLTKIEIPKMPWVKGEDDITELSDLPKLKNGDIHPDAPPRRPLSAHDLPVIDSVEVEAPFVEPTEVEPTENAAPAIVATASSITAEEAQPTLSEMVAQLEAAVTERQKQLAELEIVAAQLSARQVVVDEISAPPVEACEPAAQAAGAERTTPEPGSAKDDGMDSALAAALATLHRMTGTNR